MSQLVEDGRDWLADCFQDLDSEDVIDQLSDRAVWKAIDSYYAGGVVQFAQDGQSIHDGPTDGLPLGLTIQTDDGTFSVSTRQDIRTLWHDVRGPDGTLWGSFDSLERAIEYVTGSRADENDPGTLGPCGCTDYHMADCPTIAYTI